jgi:Low affinity iron permease
VRRPPGGRSGARRDDLREAAYRTYVCSVKNAFARFALWFSEKMGTPQAFTVALATVVAWAVTGPVFGFRRPRTARRAPCT